MNDTISKEIKQFGNLIAILIASKKITKKEIAHQADVSVNTLNNLVNGQNVGFKTLLAVLYALDMSLVSAIEAIERTGYKLTVFKSTKESVIDLKVIQEEVNEGSTPEQIGMRLGATSQEIKQVANAIV
jgi:transcriptional regulator with XRE-family HTH domain